MRPRAATLLANRKTGAHRLSGRFHSVSFVCATSLAGLALNFIFENNFKPSVGMRLDSRKIGVLITDGKSQDDIVVNSQTLRESGIELYAIGELDPPPLTCDL